MKALDLGASQKSCWRKIPITLITHLVGRLSFVVSRTGSAFRIVLPFRGCL